MYLQSQRIYTPEGLRPGTLHIEEGKITQILPHGSVASLSEDYGEKIILPGFMDIHVHGFGTGSFHFEGTPDSLRRMALSLAKTGVTSFLATTAADELDYIRQLIDVAKEGKAKNFPGADVAGIHLEGPFLSKEYKGMQKEECCIAPDMALLKEFIQRAGKNFIRLMTLAPELEGSREMIRFCKQEGIQISVGHSSAFFKDIADLKDEGLGGFTHTFSGMRGFHHRELGVVGAAMYFPDMYTEFAKQTGLTVAKEAFEIMYRLKTADRIILATDCTGLAHVQHPHHHYIRKCTFEPNGEKVRLNFDDGHVENIDRFDFQQVKDVELDPLGSIKNVIKNVHPPLEDIVKMTAENPAKYVGLFDQKGSLEKGKDADMVVVDDDFNLLAVYCRGMSVDLKD